MKAKLIIETKDEIGEYPLPIDDSMMLAIELEAAFDEWDILKKSETLRILENKEARMLDY